MTVVFHQLFKGSKEPSESVSLALITYVHYLVLNATLELSFELHVHDLLKH